MSLLSWYTIALTACLFLALVALYRLFLHPLRSFPGPKLAAISPWYGAYYDIICNGAMPFQLENLHARYGSVVRIAPNELHFSSAAAYSTIYGSGSKFTKSAEFYNPYDVPESSAGLIDPVASKRRREMLLPFFSRRSVLQFETVVQEKVNKLIEKLARYSTSGEVVDLRRAFQSVTLDNITTYATGRDVKALDHPTFNSLILEGLEAVTQLGWVFRYMPFLRSIGLLFPMHLLPAHVAALFRVRDSITQQVDEILSDPSVLERDASHNVIYRHLVAAHPEKGSREVPSRMALIHETTVLLTAGSDTVSTTCMVGAFHLLKNAVMYARLVKELDEAWLDPDIPLGYQQLEKLPYLTAVIKESLRVGNGASTPLRRVAPSDTQIAGYPVPKGTTVSVGVTFMHRNEDAFPDPDRFDPERWLRDDASALEEYFVPFSKGSRMCLGINLAWCELYVLFANLFRKLDITADENLKRVERLTFSDYFLPLYHQKVTVRIMRSRD